MTANKSLFASPNVTDFAQRIGVSKQTALYALVGSLGNTEVLSGTKDELRRRGT